MNRTAIKEDIHKDVLDRIRDLEAVDIEDVVRRTIFEKYPLISKQDINLLFKDVLQDIRGFGFLETFLKDENVTEIMINSPRDGFIEKNGELEKIEFQSTQQDLIRLIQKIISYSGNKFDKLNPIVDAWLQDGSRVNAIMPPVSPDGPYITIRKFSNAEFTLEDFCRSDSQLEILSQAIENRENIVFSGSTSSGKTTLLNTCLSSISGTERLISIEETAELKVKHPHHIRLVSKKANSEGVGLVSISDLVKTSLRMRPDRIIIGEVRSKEAFDLVQAMNTGHSGSMCTIHANGPEEVLRRVASLAMFAHKGLEYKPLLDQVVFGIDLIIFVGKQGSRERKIQSIHKVVRSDDDYRIENLQTQDKI